MDFRTSVTAGIFRHAACVAAAFLGGLPAAAAEGERDSELARQMQQYDVVATKSIRELQPFRESTQAERADGTRIELVSLNPNFGRWFLLDITPGEGRQRTRSYHIEAASPEKWKLTLARGDDPALIFERGETRHECRPWAGNSSSLEAAQSSALPYAPICDSRAYLRNRVRGSRTNREAVAEFLRDNVAFGDSIVGLIKGAFYEDAFMKSGEVVDNADAGQVARSLGRATLSRHPVINTYFGFELEGAQGRRMEAGSWYAIKDAPGIYASAMQPGMIHPDILNRKGETNWLDNIERRADVYLVAFDLSQFEIGYEVGTDHPRLGWSSRPHGAGRNWNIPGPDGIDSAAPLVRTGMLSPAMADRVAATFTGGFKRDHGAFKYSNYATFNHGHHYGFISNGVVLSKLQPNLSTLYVLDDGSIHMRTWREEDEDLLPRILFARQNGVPLIAPDPETGEGVPGQFVRSWGGGNWSGSANADLRTLRAGACMKTVEGRQFLIYAYFSTATPSAMARTFQAYGCDYAMLLDMNSLEHTYMALYTQEEDRLVPHHLVSGMAQIDDRRRDGTPIPRFVGFSDNRDFFYLLRK
ncbi:hypothetical protein [Roseovarius salinarum]|uniref:hypothetical protein n=1 Tax=Roseovarius salinarum TaxID=1981892 RepID=UPI000C3291AA|nr:hypothetical protein [Roseovarius salinarum]